MAEAKPLTVREALLLVLDQVDYTKGACSFTEMVGACLPAEVIDRARQALAAHGVMVDVAPGYCNPATGEPYLRHADPLRDALQQIANMDPAGQRADDLGRAARIAHIALGVEACGNTPYDEGPFTLAGDGVAVPDAATVPLPLADAQMLLAWMDATFGNDSGTDWLDEDAAAVGDALNKAVEDFKRMRAACGVTASDGGQQ